MDKGRHPHVIRTWAVERSRHTVHPDTHVFKPKPQARFWQRKPVEPKKEPPSPAPPAP